jgi:hypothetical protein
VVVSILYASVNDCSNDHVCCGFSEMVMPQWKTTVTIFMGNATNGAFPLMLSSMSAAAVQKRGILYNLRTNRPMVTKLQPKIDSLSLQTLTGYNFTGYFHLAAIRKMC